MTRLPLLLLGLVPLWPAFGQMVVPGGTSVHVEAGTSLRIEAPLTWTLAAGSSVVNDGLITLGSETRLDEETGAAITGLGTERITLDLPAPVNAEDPGGLGGVISTDIAPGNTLVVRGHVPYTDYSGQMSIARWIDFSPANNAGSNATLSFRFDPSELGGMAETEQRLHIRAAQDVWWFLSGNVDTGNHTVSTNGLDSLGLFTTFDEDLPNSIPVEGIGARFTLLGAPGAPLFLNVPVDERVETLHIYGNNGTLLLSARPRWSAGLHALPAFHPAAGVYHLRVNDRHDLPFLVP